MADEQRLSPNCSSVHQNNPSRGDTYTDQHQQPCQPAAEPREGILGPDLLFAVASNHGDSHVYGDPGASAVGSDMLANFQDIWDDTDLLDVSLLTPQFVRMLLILTVGSFQSIRVPLVPTTLGTGCP